MELHTKFYGVISCEEKEAIEFPLGLPGFEDKKRFLHLQPEDSIFGCLQSIEDPSLAFVVISPYIICPEYNINLTQDDIQALKLNKADEALVLSIVSIREKIEESTANLQAPIVLHRKDLIGRQVLLPESGYPIRFPLWKKDGVLNIRCS